MSLSGRDISPGCMQLIRVDKSSPVEPVRSTRVGPPRIIASGESLLRPLWCFPRSCADAQIASVDVQCPGEPDRPLGSVSTEAACSISWTELEEEAGLRRHSTLGGKYPRTAIPVSCLTCFPLLLLRRPCRSAVVRRCARGVGSCLSSPLHALHPREEFYGMLAQVTRPTSEHLGNRPLLTVALHHPTSPYGPPGPSDRNKRLRCLPERQEWVFRKCQRTGVGCQPRSIPAVKLRDVPQDLRWCPTRRTMVKW